MQRCLPSFKNRWRFRSIRSTVVPVGTEDGDAGEFYRQAIKERMDNPVPYERFEKQENKSNFDLKKLTALDFLIKAGNCKSYNLFKPDELVNYKNDQPRLNALDDVGKLCSVVGMLYNPKFKVHDNPEEARKLWEAEFVLGRHFYEERITWMELGYGLGLMSEGARNLQQFYTDIQKDHRRRMPSRSSSSRRPNIRPTWSRPSR